MRISLLALALLAAVSAEAATVRLRNAAPVYVVVELTGGGVDLHTYLGPGEEKFISRELFAGDVVGTVWGAGLVLDAQLQEAVAALDGTETALECYVEPDTGALNFVPVASVDTTGWPFGGLDAVDTFRNGFFVGLGWELFGLILAVVRRIRSGTGMEG